MNAYYRDFFDFIEKNIGDTSIIDMNRCHYDAKIIENEIIEYVKNGVKNVEHR